MIAGKACGITIAAGILALLAAGCGSSASPVSAPPAAAASTAAASSSPPSCTSMLISWRDGGGLSDVAAVENDLNSLSGSLTTLGTDVGTGVDLSSDEAHVQQDAASLQSDTQTAQADLPPSCVPGLRRNVSAALTDYNKAAIDCGQAVTEATSGNDSIATSDIYAAAHWISLGNGKLTKATASIKAYAGS